MNMAKGKQKISAILPTEMIAQLKEEAKKHQRSFNGELVWAIQQYLEQQQKGEHKHDESV
jgi:hypothetical protein